MIKKSVYSSLGAACVERALKWFFLNSLIQQAFQRTRNLLIYVYMGRCVSKTGDVACQTFPKDGTEFEPFLLNVLCSPSPYKAVFSFPQ
mmetsp:Transcript_17020/g.22491  ORF Transcript_17020/g.22491 Transcript_17020/m.22491 type:complete len:89 (+) Transcript_17020:59-325(+)